MRADLEIIHEWIPSGSRVLDLGCGDGDLLASLAEHKQVSGYGLEIDPDKITACIARGINVVEQNIDQGLGNFASNSFDVVVMTQSLQALQYPDKVLAEMLRVTAPGGRVVICEFSYPTWAPFRHVYTKYLLAAIPAMAKLASSNRDAYDYLAESILAWPDQPHLADMMAEAGWQAIAWRNVCGGVVALHRGWKGSDEKEMA